MFHIKIEFICPREITELRYFNGELQPIKIYWEETRRGIKINLKTRRVDKTFYIPLGGVKVKK